MQIFLNIKRFSLITRVMANTIISIPIVHPVDRHTVRQSLDVIFQMHNCFTRKFLVHFVL